MEVTCHSLTRLQVKPEYAQIEQAQIMESGLENSFAREHYSTAIEKGINEQINTVRISSPCGSAAARCVLAAVVFQHWSCLWGEHTPLCGWRVQPELRQQCLLPEALPDSELCFCSTTT